MASVTTDAPEAMVLRNRRARAGVVLGIALMLTVANLKSPACLIPDSANDADYIAAGSAMQTNLLSLKIYFADKTTGQIVANTTTSAARLNERCVLTAAHNFTLFTGQYDIARCEVGTGPNYTTNRGTVRPSFKYLIHPGYNPDPNHTGDGPDIAIVYLAASLVGTNATIGSAGVGEILTHAGFGDTAAPSTPTFRDRNSRAWRASVHGWVSSQFNPAYYDETEFYPYIPLNGQGLPGDSGGPVYNSAGQLVGLNKAGATGTPESGFTVFLKLSQPDVLSWIEQNTTNLTVNPPNLVLNGVGALNLTGDTNQIYGILSSTNLTEWQEIGLVTNLTGSVNFQDPAAASFPHRFYRAVAK